MARKAKSKGGDDARVHVICGKDKFLVSGECKRLLDSLLTPEERGLSLFQPEDASKVELVDVLDELRTLAFLSDKRVVILKDADSFVTANREGLEKYFAAPSKSGVLILVVESWAKTTRLAKKLPEIGQLIDVSAMTARQLPAYVANYAKSTHGKNMTNATASILVELVGDDAGRLCSEADKLAIYTADRKSIEPADVEALIGHNRMFGAFNVIDAITAGAMDKAISRLRNMFAMDKSADYTVVGAFAFHFRKMFRAKAMMEKGESTGTITSKLRVFGDRNGFFRQVRTLNLKTIGKVICELAHIDHGIKTGQTTAPIAIERLVVKLNAALNVRR